MTSSRVFADSNLDPRFRAGLVGHWIGGGSGLTWFDRSGNGNHGALTNGPTWTLGAGGKRNALAFDGSDDYVALGTKTSLDLSGDYSFAMWVNTNVINTAVQYLVGSYNAAGSATQWAIDINRTAGRFDLISANLVQLTSSTTVVAQQWNHLAVTVKGTECVFYLGGRADGQATLSGRNAQQEASIGRPGAYNGNYFNGALDDVRVYNRALSSAEIATLASPSYSPIIGGGLICGL